MSQQLMVSPAAAVPVEPLLLPVTDNMTADRISTSADSTVTSSTSTAAADSSSLLSTSTTSADSSTASAAAAPMEVAAEQLDIPMKVPAASTLRRMSCDLETTRIIEDEDDDADNEAKRMKRYHIIYVSAAGAEAEVDSSPRGFWQPQQQQLPDAAQATLAETVTTIIAPPSATMTECQLPDESVYVEAIYDTLHERELRRRPFAGRSPQAAERSKYVQLIQIYARNVSVLKRNTVHLAVYLLDLFMDAHHIAAERLMLVALCCLQLAAKMEESTQCVPKMRHLRAFACNSFTALECCQLEHFALRFFHYELLIPTAVTFFEYFVQTDGGIADAGDLTATVHWRLVQIRAQSGGSNGSSSGDDALALMRHTLLGLAVEYLDTILCDAVLVQQLPSRMAAACLAAARHTWAPELPWSGRLQHLTRYSRCQLKHAVRGLLLVRQSPVVRQLAAAAAKAAAAAEAAM